MKVAPESGESGLLLVSAIQRETISVYFSHLANINFDESIDMLPTQQQNDNQPTQASIQMPQQSPAQVSKEKAKPPQVQE